MDVPARESPLQSETPQGTLDMLVLRVLERVAEGEIESCKKPR
jgi:hypothetical protein